MNLSAQIKVKLASPGFDQIGATKAHARYNLSFTCSFMADTIKPMSI